MRLGISAVWEMMGCRHLKFLYIRGHVQAVAPGGTCRAIGLLHWSANANAMSVALQPSLSAWACMLCLHVSKGSYVPVW